MFFIPGVIIPDLSYKTLMDNIKNMSRPTQSVAVKGVLLCNGIPVSNVLVKLYDHDSEFFKHGYQT